MFQFLARRHVLLIAVFGLYGGLVMTDAQKDPAEVDRLLRTLGAENVRPDDLEKGLPEFSAASKDEAVRQIARMFAPEPSGKLLARLPFILTARNRSDMTAAFIVNLNSPEPAARKFSLYGLEQLKHPALADLALIATRDADDQVAYAACFILLPTARQDARLWKILQGLYGARKDRQEFLTTVNFLRAQGIEGPGPAEK